MDRSRRKICTLFSKRFGGSGIVVLLLLFMVLVSVVVGWLLLVDCEDVPGGDDEFSSVPEHRVLMLLLLWL